MTTFGINGFGRIGRNCVRVWWQDHKKGLKLGLINTSGSMDLKGWFHLLKYDTSYGVFDAKLSMKEHQSKDEVSDDDPVLGTITVGDQEITVTAQRDPAKIPWGKYGVEVVLESTGAFRKEEEAKLHKKGGAKRVIVSAPAKGDGVSTGVMGVNEIDLSAEVQSNASCTTNCVAPVMQLMVSNFGVEKAMLTTIHAYTDDQNVEDNSHKKDLRRARAAAANIIPTSTGAAKATTKIIPDLNGVFDGLAVRVPVPTGSLSDMTFLTKKEVTVEEVNAVFEKATKEKRWKGILAVTHDPIVSSDIVGRPESSIVDLELTRVVGGNLVKVISWYDNEWGYCNRLVEQILQN